MDRLHQELATLPGLAQLSASQLRDLPWRVKEMVFIALFREQISSSTVAEELQIKSRDRKLERKADKLLDDRSSCGAEEGGELSSGLYASGCCGVGETGSAGVNYVAEHGMLLEDCVRAEEVDMKVTIMHRTMIVEKINTTPPKAMMNLKKGSSFTSQSASNNKNTGLGWNFDTTIETPVEEDELDGFINDGSSEKNTQIERTARHQTGAGISIERTFPSKQPSYFASKFKKNALQALHEENAALTSENAKLRDEIKQLEALNVVLQCDNSNNGMLDDRLDSSEFAQKRMRLLQAQNLQLQRQVSLLQQAMQVHENAELSLMSALNNWRCVIEAGKEEARTAGADQNATDPPTEPEETGTRQPIKWMLAVPDKLMNELKRVEGQIQGASNAANACFETKLRVSKLSASFLRNEDTSLKICETYSGGPLSLAHLRVERVKQLEDALGSVSAHLDELSAQVLQRFPPKVSTTDPLRSRAYELGRSVQVLLLEVGAFGVVVPTPSIRNAAASIDDERVTVGDIIKALSWTTGVARGPGGAKDREKQAKMMLKQLHARHTATENDLVACRREAEYWRTAWCTQDDILRRLAKCVRGLGQKKVEWCQHYLLTPMVNLSEVFTSFQQAYDENSTRQNPYLPLLVETLSMEHPMLQDALQQWREYSNDAQLKMDELVADYEANRLVLASSFDAPATPVFALDIDTLSFDQSSLETFYRAIQSINLRELRHLPAAVTKVYYTQ
ncbi:hypothetical protein PC111_g6150 [Phytophthora cactorum]|nr:hypothetical protein PC111_g6150 [Phytophthora cactorum]KAG3027083.1 hypothetical protein PC120_g5582 [Phytophthora cactorum]